MTPPPPPRPNVSAFGALYSFHSLNVVEVAVVLHIIADTVYIEVGGGCVSADDRRITMSFSLCHRDARNVAYDVSHVEHVLIPDQVVVHYGDGLGDVEKRCWCFCRVAGEDLVIRDLGDGDDVLAMSHFEDDFERLGQSICYFQSLLVVFKAVCGDLKV